MSNRMKAEMAGSPKCHRDRWHAALIVNVARSIDTVNEDLGLEGLRILWTRARAGDAARWIDTRRAGRYTAPNLVRGGPGIPYTWG